MNSSVFFELVIEANGIDSAKLQDRWDIEEELESSLQENAWGEVTGGGTGTGFFIIDIELNELKIAEGLSNICQILRDQGLIKFSRLRDSRTNEFVKLS